MLSWPGRETVRRREATAMKPVPFESSRRIYYVCTFSCFLLFSKASYLKLIFFLAIDSLFSWFQGKAPKLAKQLVFRRLQGDYGRFEGV